ncbi:MAG: acyl transferase [Leeuwenhoekiella sp.]
MYIPDIFNITQKEDFNEAALLAFQNQYDYNEVYHKYCVHLQIKRDDVISVRDIPYLPIAFFKYRDILFANKKAATVLTSSGTSGDVQSKHHVADIWLYKNSFRKSFQLNYGDIREYTILALLPSYLERSDSSLVYMADQWIQSSKNKDSGFHLDDLPALREKLKALDAAGRKVLLLGVSFALLDLAEIFDGTLNNTIIMETGGMKGRRKEIVRQELHDILKKGFGVKNIHSEYGMTELLSQAYSKRDGIFSTPPWMQVSIRDSEDPFSTVATGKTGGINIIDLANWYSCPFVATDDLGRKDEDGNFEVLGRFDTANVRGCNLMVV